MRTREILKNRAPKVSQTRVGEDLENIEVRLQRLEERYGKLLEIVISMANTNPKMLSIITRELDREAFK